MTEWTMPADPLDALGLARMTDDTWGKLKAINDDLLAALKFLVAAAETEPGMSIYKAHIAEAQAVIAKVEGVKL